MIEFGVLSITLLVGTAQGLVLALMLWRSADPSRVSRTAGPPFIVRLSYQLRPPRMSNAA